MHAENARHYTDGGHRDRHPIQGMEGTPVTPVKPASCCPIDAPHGEYDPEAQTGIDKTGTALQMQTLCSSEIHIRQMTPSKYPNKKTDTAPETRCGEICR